MPVFPVSERKHANLIERMRRLHIREGDLDESFVRSSGAGGQNVNKTATCVVLVHHPTGEIVKCQKARTQGLNRYLARQILVDRIERKVLGEKSAERRKIEKIRRQKRKRSRRSREKMLADKRIRGEKKALRGRIRPHRAGD
jgi:peptide chain release factor